MKTAKSAIVDVYAERHVLTKKMRALVEKLFVMSLLHPTIETLYLRERDYEDVCDDLRRYNIRKYSMEIKKFTLMIDHRQVKGVNPE